MSLPSIDDVEIESSAMPSYEEVEVEGFNPLTDDPTLRKVGIGEALGRGFAQGATFGFADEISAATKALFGDNKYSEELEKNRLADKMAKDQAGSAFLAGDLSTMLIPGSAGTKVASKGLRALKMAEAAKKLEALKGARAILSRGAIEGGLYGAGTSEGDKIKGALGGAALGAGLSSVSPAIGKAWDKVPGGVKRAPKAMAKGLTSAINQTQTPSLNTYLKNRGAVREAMGDVVSYKDKIGKDFRGLSEQLRKEVSGDSGKAFKMLDEAGTEVPKDKILKAFDSQIGDATKYGEFKKSPGLDALKDMRDRVAKMEGDTIKGTSLKVLLGDLGEMAYPKSGQSIDAMGSAGIRAAKGIRGGINETLLESAPEKYKEHMGKVSQDTEALKKLRKEFLGKNEDSLNDFLARIGAGNKTGAMRSIEGLDERYGKNIGERLKALSAAKDFTGDKTRGSLNQIGPVAAGAAAGSPFGMLGAATGAGLGFAKNKYGGLMTPFMADMYLGSTGSAERVKRAFSEKMKKNPKLLEAINNARERGGSTAATHYILQKTDPSYKKEYEETELEYGI